LKAKIVDPGSGTRISKKSAGRSSEMDSSKDELVTLANGDIAMWVVSGTLHLKCVTKQGDPVELNVNELAEMVESLQRLMPQLE
jgi:hypothetical protein